MTRWLACLLVLGLWGAAGCSHKKVKKVSLRAPVRVGSSETGTASWYGDPYHGRRAANGEIYDMEKLTAAHRTLPFETWVRVVNLENGKDVQVRITDRGPFVGDRIIDLSRAAARQIDMLGPGTARVRLEIVQAPPQPPSTDLFGIQVGSFREKANATRLQERLQQQYGTARVVERADSPGLWRVLVGQYPTAAEASELAATLQTEFGRVFVVRWDQ